jgi:hypothetical protein
MPLAGVISAENSQAVFPLRDGKPHCRGHYSGDLGCLATEKVGVERDARLPRNYSAHEVPVKKGKCETENLFVARQDLMGENHCVEGA